MDSARELLIAADRFRDRLEAVKRQIPDIPWYPYDSFGVFSFLPGLLKGSPAPLLELAGDEPVLDAGTADGDLAFFFESLGCHVDALDNPLTNNNSMLGIERLKAALGSSVGILRVDLDAPFELPAPRYGLGLCLGLLYHLKNPFQHLETLARKVRYCLLSTRIAQVSPDRRTDLRQVPVAYLVDPRELNQDPTNFWIFSEPGLRRLVARSGWDLLSMVVTGFSAGSDPASTHGDQRAYCLLKSRTVDPAWHVCLTEGWHELEDSTWRWTARRFSARIELERPVRFRRLELDFYYPPAQADLLGPLTLRCRLNGVELGGQLLGSAGEHTYIQPVPAEAPLRQALELEFELDKASGPTEQDIRELGVIVNFRRAEGSASDTNLPLRLITEAPAS